MNSDYAFTARDTETACVPPARPPRQPDHCRTDNKSRVPRYGLIAGDARDPNIDLSFNLA